MGTRKRVHYLEPKIINKHIKQTLKIMPDRGKHETTHMILNIYQSNDGLLCTMKIGQEAYRPDSSAI